MTFLPQKPHIYPHGARLLKHQRISFCCQLSPFLLPACLNSLQSCSICFKFGLSCYFFTKGLWEFHYRPLVNLSADLYASLDTHKESCSTGGGDELFLLNARESNGFIAVLFPPPWKQSKHNLAAHSSVQQFNEGLFLIGEEALMGFMNTHANWRPL